MNNLLERFKNMLYESERPLSQRMFLLATTIASITLIAVMVISVGSGQGLAIYLVLGVLVVVLSGMTVYVYRTGKTTVAAVILSILIGLVAFPLGFLFGGGAYSGTSIWFIIAIAFMATIFRTNYFWVYAIISSIAFGVVVYLSYLHPELVVPLANPDLIYIDMYIPAVAVAFLVSALLRYTSRIYNAESELAQAQKEEIQALSDAQSRFFSSMSHEIRTPLNTIIGLNEMTLRDPQISEETAENATNIQNASRMLLSLINDVLDISKIESGRMELAESQYETSRMLSDIVNLLWSRAKDKGLNFEINVGEDVPSMLYGDEMRLKQVIINVLTNAIKYTEEGTVSLTIGGEKSGSNKFMLRVDVDDTGIGIRKEAIPYLFDSFKRVDTDRNRNVEGTGLGLAISKQLVDLMGGTITVDSIFTKGSHFQIEVPQRIASSAPMQYSSITERSNAGLYEHSFEAPEAHVLIVDDNDMNRMVSRKLLRATRVQVDMAASGAECLEKTAEVHYDVIFMDHEMPDMDGLQTLEKVREQPGGLCKNTPIVALTANAGSDMNAFYLNHGFAAYLAKPIHGSLLEATLLQFLPNELVESFATQEEGETINILASRRKKRYAVTVDCPCDLPEEILAEKGIARIPFYIITKEGRFRDVEEIDSDNLFSYLADGGSAQTSPGTVEEYERFFGDMLDNAEVVVHVSVSSRVSNSYEMACKAADSFGNVHVIDSCQFSSGMGLVAMHAAQLAEKDLELEEILAGTDAYIDQVVTSVYMSSYDSPALRIGMPGPIRAVLSALNLDPVFRLGRRGMRLAALHGGYVTESSEKFLRAAMRKAKRSNTKKTLYIVYSGFTLEEQERIHKLAEEHSDFEEILMLKASATVAANCWMHSFGIMYER